MCCGMASKSVGDSGHYGMLVGESLEADQLQGNNPALQKTAPSQD